MVDNSPSFHGETSGPKPEADLVLLPLTKDEFFYLVMLFSQHEAVLKYDLSRALYITKEISAHVIEHDEEKFNALVDKVNKLSRIACEGSNYIPVGGS